MTVAVIDTGVDDTHPDLAPNFDRGASANCVSGAPDTTAGSWRPAAGESDHGTHVAGTIAAAKNGTGITGVAPGVKVAGIKVSTPGGWFYTEAVVCGFMWAADHGVDVTNNSYYTDPWMFNCKNDRSPCGLGGVCGEDGPDVEVLDGLAQVLGVRVLEPVGGAGQQSALGGTAVTHLVGAVDLLGDVGEVEVGGEGAHELRGGLQVRVAEELGRGLTIGAGQGADTLDEVEKFLALLAYEGLAQQVAEAADVGPQFGAGGRGLVGTAHSVRLLAVVRARLGGRGPRLQRC